MQSMVSKSNVKLCSMQWKIKVPLNIPLLLKLLAFFSFCFMRINSKKTAKDTNIPPKIPEVLRSHQEMKNFLQCVPAFKQIKI